MTKPLEGIKVVDFTRHMAGPYGTMFLSDYGADVIKVESLPDGDGSRNIGTAFVGDQSALFLIWNRGKRSIALNLREAEGLEAVHRVSQDGDERGVRHNLAQTCTVVSHVVGPHLQ